MNIQAIVRGIKQPKRFSNAIIVLHWFYKRGYTWKYAFWRAEMEFHFDVNKYTNPELFNEVKLWNKMQKAYNARFRKG